MIARMAKPEEVIVVEDENGNIVRETMKDTDTLARYKTMHETLVYLSNLGHEDTETQMLEQLRLQVRSAQLTTHDNWLTHDACIADRVVYTDAEPACKQVIRLPGIADDSCIYSLHVSPWVMLCMYS